MEGYEDLSQLDSAGLSTTKETIVMAITDIYRTIDPDSAPTVDGGDCDPDTLSQLSLEQLIEYRGSVNLQADRFRRLMNEIIRRGAATTEQVASYERQFNVLISSVRAVISGKINFFEMQRAQHNENAKQVMNMSASKAIINKVENYVKRIAENISSEPLSTLKRRLNDVINAERSYEAAYNIIQDLASTEEHQALEIEFETFTIRVEKLLRTFDIAIGVATNTRPTDETSIKVKIPPTIFNDKFDGKMENWPKFQAKFERLIHNNRDIPEVQKGTFLVELYQPKGTNVLDSYSIDDGNYQKAWEAVKARHNNPRKIRNYYFNKLLTVQSIRTPSMQEFQRVRDTFDDIFTKFEREKISFEQLKVYLVEKTFDIATDQAWKDHLETHEDTWEVIQQFLEKRSEKFDKESHANTNQKTSSSSMYSDRKLSAPTSKTYAVMSQSNSCVVCNGEHKLYACMKFKQMKIDEKFEALKKFNLCFNCFSSNHSYGKCPLQSYCRTCSSQGIYKQQHHTWLHVPGKDYGRVKNDNSRPMKETHHQTNPDTPFNVFPRSVQSANSNVATKPEIHFQANVSTSATASQSSKSLDVIDTHSIERHNPLLTTTVVYIIAADGTRYQVRALLDSGSDCNIVTSRLADALGFKRQAVTRPMTGLGGNVSSVVAEMNILMKSGYGNFTVDARCNILPKLTNQIPSKFMDISTAGISDSLHLADPKFNVPGPIDIILGGEVYMFSILGNIVKLPSGLMLLETMFGWVVGGRANLKITREVPKQSSQSLISCQSLVANTSLETLNEKINEFINNENIGIDDNKMVMSIEDNVAEQYFRATTTRQENGQYVVRLPLTDNVEHLTSCYPLALSQQKSLNDARIKYPLLYEAYDKYMQDIISQNIIELVEPCKRHDGFYLPHHGVSKVTSTTTKMRPVFNGSKKYAGGLSLNDCMLKGPTVQPESFDILLRFRQHPIALKCDLEKMFLRIIVHPDDRKYMKILWSPDPRGPILHYQSNAVIFGLKPATYLATRTINQLATDNEMRYPDVSKLILSSFYVDDGLFSLENLEEAKRVQNNLLSVFKSAGMRARKWSSNRDELTSQLDPEDCDPINDDGQILVLGHPWHVKNDTLGVVIKTQTNVNITKTSVLSYITSFYDLLGIFGPVTLKAKLYMKEITNSKIGWTDTPSSQFQDSWRIFVKKFTALQSVNVPRNILIIQPVKIELHGFSDASEVAYGCCIYLRSIDENSNVGIQLVCSKSRVSPAKVQTLARLELCAAVLLSKVTSRIQNTLTVSLDSTHQWSDSMITLHWIHNSPTRYHTYVQNRIAAIQENFNSVSWHHIAGKDNPADLLSRGLDPDVIAHNSLWWHGPRFLLDPDYQITNEEFGSAVEIDKELKIQARLCLHIVIPTDLIDLIENRHSDYNRIIRQIAMLKKWRFIVIENKYKRLNNIQLRHRNVIRSHPTNTRVPQRPLEKIIFDAYELDQTLITIIRILQMNHFSSEYFELEQHQQIQLDSKIATLAPFIDKDKLLRVGGRLTNANIPYDQRNPVIIPHCKFAEIYVRHRHNESNHPPKKSLIAYIRQRFWIMKLKQIVSKVNRNCRPCFILSTKPSLQYMSDLPAARVNISRPFEKVSVDYTGYYTMKDGMRPRSPWIKVYIAMFKCMTTAAIHLELVTSLSRESFLEAFERFIGRRGLCSEIFSDNATNFRATSNEFRESYLKHRSKIQNFCAEKGIKWTFTTPLAPHAGGYYEAGIKSLKYHLKRALNDHPYTYEKFNTLLISIEADLNSRPLTPMSDDPEDLDVLTPGHFIIGRPLNSTPQHNFLPVKEHLLTMFNRISRVRQIFWRDWQTHYLQELQKRPRNALKKIEYAEGQFVVVIDNSMPPRKWKLGRITKLIPGKDKVTRNVVIKTSTGEIERNVRYIVVLPYVEPYSTSSEEENEASAAASIQQDSTEPQPSSAPPQCVGNLAMISTPDETLFSYNKYF